MWGTIQIYPYPLGAVSVRVGTLYDCHSHDRIKEGGNYSYRRPNIAVYDYGIISDIYMELYEHIFIVTIVLLFLVIHDNWLMSCQWVISTTMEFTDDAIQK